MTELETTLQRLGLHQYYDAFLTEGFETWETVLDIQESDLYVHAYPGIPQSADSSQGIAQCKVGSSSGKESRYRILQWADDITRYCREL